MWTRRERTALAEELRQVEIRYSMLGWEAVAAYNHRMGAWVTLERLAEHSCYRTWLVVAAR